RLYAERKCIAADALALVRLCCPLCQRCALDTGGGGHVSQMVAASHVNGVCGAIYNNFISDFAADWCAVVADSRRMQPQPAAGLRQFCYPAGGEKAVTLQGQRMGQ